MPIAIVFLVLELVATWDERAAFAPVLRVKVTPDPVIEKRTALAAR